MLKRANTRDDFRAINGYSWDYVMVFQVYKADRKLSQAQEDPKNSIKGVVSRLADAGLETKLYYSVQNDEVYCKIRANLKRLMKEADRVEYIALLEPNAIANALREGNMNGPEENRWSPKEVPHIPDETTIEPYEYIYAPFEYKDATKRALFKKHANGLVFRGVDRMKLIAGILKARPEDGGAFLDVYRLMKSECLLAFFPLHDFVELRELEEKWIRFVQAPWRQNVDLVKDYFGEKIGLYFLWLGHYTTCLIYASAAGIIAWLFIAGQNGNPDSVLLPYFAAFMALWATIFVETWKRKEKRNAMRWGMVGYENNEQERPEFDGEWVPHPVNGSRRLYFPPRDYAQRVSASTTVVSVLICAVIAIVAGIMVFKIIESTNSRFLIGKTNTASTIASLLNAVQIQLMNYIYGTVSVWLNEYENHRTDTAFEDALIGKTFVFQFVNSFVSLFYIAFVKQYLGSLDPCLVSCMLELQNALSAIFLTRLATGNILKILLPKVDSYFRSSSETAGIGVDKNIELSEVEKMFMLTPYHVTLDTFADYAEMVIQFGYATMFVVSFPLATVMALVNNYMMMRVEAWKLCQLCRRPEPRSCEDIGTWTAILEIISTTAVMVNAGIIVFTGSITQQYTWAVRVWIFIAIVTIISSVKLVLAVAIPDVEEEVDTQLLRQEFIVGKIFDNIGDVDKKVAKRSVELKTNYTIRITDDDPL